MSQQLNEILDEMKAQDGTSLAVLSEKSPVLLVFLRHFGCMFCIEAMKDIAGRRKALETRGVLICMVHMADTVTAESYFREYGLAGITHISDPDCEYYSKFGLIKGDFGQLFGLRVWLRTAELAIKDISNWRRKRIGDGFQMPGVFLLHKRSILAKFIHSQVSDRPDYDEIASCAMPS